MHATSDVLRIIDANLNRAREALRVMEEYARLSLDDAGLTASIKETRHRLAAAVQALENTLRRDVVGKIAQVEGCDSENETPLIPPLARGEVERAPSVSADSSADLGQRASNVTADSSATSGQQRRGSVLARSRDIAADVGRDVTTPSEYERKDASHVALAGGKRLSEALRSVEEYGKTLDSAFAAAIEKIRYEGYELERRMNATIGARERLGAVGLYVIITESLCDGDWFATAEAALAGGADAIQLREKALSDGELLERAKRLAELCRAHGALFVVNDRPDIAALSHADGVHLGQDDLPVSAARRALPAGCIIGVSTHNLEQVVQVAAEVPDYIAVGPMFPTETKPQDHIAGPETLRAAKEHTALPLVAIGGIEAANVHEVLSATPCIVCLCSAVIARPDVREATVSLCKSLEAAWIDTSR